MGDKASMQGFFVAGPVEGVLGRNQTPMSTRHLGQPKPAKPPGLQIAENPYRI